MNWYLLITITSACVINNVMTSSSSLLNLTLESPIPLESSIPFGANLPPLLTLTLANPSFESDVSYFGI